MFRNVGLFLCLLASCTANSEMEEAGESRPSKPEQTPIETNVAHDREAPGGMEDEKLSERSQVNCAALAAAYQSDRNSLFGGDRKTLRVRLATLGDVYRARMKEIPGCDFSVL